jgi:branched-chain amino acid transport system substrate-binding protein
VIGLDADMSSGSGLAGEAIRRGALIAMQEINGQGGLLGGRKLELISKDHHGNPVRSTDNLQELTVNPNLVAVLAGLHSPPIINNQAFLHEHKIILLVPWAAATAVVDHAFTPNYIFRVSIRDQFTGPFLVDKALQQGYAKLGLILERTGWGRGNEKSVTAALAKVNKVPAAVEWFNQGETDMIKQILDMEAAGVDAVIMVANAPEGSAIVKEMARRPEGERLPIFSHWGITGGEFPALAGDSIKKVKLQVLQTYSFINATGKVADQVIQQYKSMFKAGDVREIFAPVGTAHAYDLVHILALAIQKAGTTERSQVRDALEQIDSYAGLIREYRPPFTPKWHEGLDTSDYRLATFDANGVLLPIEKQ